MEWKSKSSPECLIRAVILAFIAYLWLQDVWAALFIGLVAEEFLHPKYNSPK